MIKANHRVAIYLRVSTLDQTTANQERELREVVSRMGCEVVKVYRDHGGRSSRPFAPLTSHRTAAWSRRDKPTVVFAPGHRLNQKRPARVHLGTSQLYPTPAMTTVILSRPPASKARSRRVWAHLLRSFSLMNTLKISSSDAISVNPSLQRRSLSPTSSPSAVCTWGTTVTWESRPPID